MADIREKIDADLTRLERDKAVADAQRAEAERNVLADVATSAVVQRDEAEYDRLVSTNQADAAKQWGAQNAAARVDAERQAIDSEARAQSNAGALWVVGGLVVVLLLGWLIWYLNQPSPQSTAGTSTTIVDHTAPPSAAPAPAPAPSTNTTTIVPVQVPPPAPAANPAPAASAPPVVINNNNPTPSAAPDNSQSAQPTSPSNSANDDNTPGGTAPQSNNATGNGVPDSGTNNGSPPSGSGGQ